jgi:hypothetical protein
MVNDLTSSVVDRGSIRGWIKPNPNTTGVTSGAGIACTFGAPEFVLLDL